MSDDPPVGDLSEELRLIRKATAVVTRGAGAAREVLVFAHPRTGLQLPAGTVEEGESFEDAAVRELAEETGLTQVSLRRELGALDEVSPAGNRFDRHVFHLEPAQPVEDRWDGICDCGDEITLFWISFDTGHLDRRQQPWLDLARTALAEPAS